MSAQAVIPFFFDSFFMNKIREDFEEFQQALITIKFWWMLIVLTFGCFVFSSVVNGILIPHHFFSGGLTGLALLFYDYLQAFLP